MKNRGREGAIPRKEWNSLKNKIKKIAVALWAFTVGCACLTGCNVRQDTIRFGAAGVGGGYYAFATAYTQLANAEDA